jgi:hypothetical protein
VCSQGRPRRDAGLDRGVVGERAAVLLYRSRYDRKQEGAASAARKRADGPRHRCHVARRVRPAGRDRPCPRLEPASRGDLRLVARGGHGTTGGKSLSAPGLSPALPRIGRADEPIRCRRDDRRALRLRGGAPGRQEDQDGGVDHVAPPSQRTLVQLFPARPDPEDRHRGAAAPRPEDGIGRPAHRAASRTTSTTCSP